MGLSDLAAMEAAPRPAVDLRSDVLSPPTPDMFEALAAADIGWSLRSEDPSVARLEALGADRLGTEASVFVPNATTANLLALLVQLERGDAVLMDATAHINVVEWYALALGGLVPRTIPSDRGHLSLTAAEAALADSAGGRAPRIGLVVIENTHTFAGGVVIDPDETASVADLAHRHGAVVHLDGARLFHAAVARGLPVSAFTAGVDSIAVSLSKGLCAPYGGLLAGSAAVVERARSLAFRIGFGRIHKSGYLAAAGFLALDTMVDRLADDHRRARRLGDAWARIDGLVVDLETVQTNIVQARLHERFGDPDAVAARVAEHGVGVMSMPGRHLRAVVHRGIDDDGIDSAVRVVRAVLT